ncbi:MAG: adenosylcobinamide-GDP ribazoletransferase [Magnetococcales bacterium]|nr:adenosylcobinamide-GDP ribazoletransferase [Magnetococcales bacterium]
MRPLWIALGLLTRVPVRLSVPPSEQEMGHSVLAYPVVGLLLGGCLAGLAIVFPFWGQDLQAALLLACWVWMTGGLHLDGLADSADAWVGGMGNRERSLAILKDACSGPMAIVTLVLLLLIKWAAIKALLLADQPGLFILPPMLGRGGMVLIFLTLPYVRSNGMGAAAARMVPRTGGWIVLAAVSGGCLYGYGNLALLTLLCCLGVLGLLRRLLRQRLGGTTGDTVGAVCELLEMVALLALVHGVA